MSLKTGLLWAIAGLADLIPHRRIKQFADWADLQADKALYPKEFERNVARGQATRQPSHFEVKRTEETK